MSTQKQKTTIQLNLGPLQAKSLQLAAEFAAAKYRETSPT